MLSKMLDSEKTNGKRPRLTPIEGAKTSSHSMPSDQVRYTRPKTEIQWLLLAGVNACKDFKNICIKKRQGTLSKGVDRNMVRLPA